MAANDHLDPGPFFLDGGPIGALLVHGFTGAPTEMRPIGERLASHGWTVSGPLLPGHGTRVEEMNACSYVDWIEHVTGAYEELAARCDDCRVPGPEPALPEPLGPLL